MNLLIIVALLTKILVYGRVDLASNRSCADFNYGSSLAAFSGIENVYVCPSDGIARKTCSEKYHLKCLSSVVQSNITLNDVIFYVLIGPRSRVDALRWWLPLLTKASTTIIFIADACGDSIKSTAEFLEFGYGGSCNDSTTDLVRGLRSSFSHIHFHLTRIRTIDAGYKILSCKLRTGVKMIYDRFPNMRYYFKMDTDSILFPRHFLSFLSTLDAVAAEQWPVYFGTVVESGMNLLLCGREWSHEGDTNKGGICYAQGGAGYGLNNEGMKVLASSVYCNSTTPDTSPEDTFVAMQLFRSSRVNVVHCGGFSSSEIMTDRRLRSSITFHYIDAKWLRVWGAKLLDRYNAHEGKGGA